MRALGAALLFAGCGAEPALPDGVQLLRISADAGPWDHPDAVPMVPPAHLPSPLADRDAVSVVVRLPADGRLQQVERADGQAVLAWPAGSAADRVERWGTADSQRVVDVRGTRLDADGRRWHHVYKPVDTDPTADLIGAEWPADDPQLTAIAVDAFLAALAQTPLAGGQADPDRYLASVRRKLDCEGCHQPLRAANTVVGEHGLVARGTDAAGWFTPTTVLDASVPLEAYGAWDHNLDDPHVAVTCATGEPVRPAKARGAHARCPDRGVPTATVDLAAALSDGSSHAEAVCASWRALAARLDGADPTHACAEAP